jgi:hypothetical protein
VLVLGDNPVSVARDATSPRFVHLPASLHHDPEQVRRTRRRLAELEPALVVPVHGHPVRHPEAWRRALDR